MSQADPVKIRGRTNSSPAIEEKGKGENGDKGGEAPKDKERKERRSITAQPKRAPSGGNIIGALIKEAETKGRNHLKEVEDKRLSMIGNNQQFDALRSALEQGSKPGPQSKPSPSPTPTTNPNPTNNTSSQQQPSRANRGSIIREQDKKKEEDTKTKIEPETNGGGGEKSGEKEKNNSDEVKERPKRSSFRGGTNQAAPEEGKATFSKEEVKKYKDEMIRRYEEEESRRGKKKREIPPGPGVGNYYYLNINNIWRNRLTFFYLRIGAPAPPPRVKPEGSPQVQRKEEEGPASPEKMKRLRQNVIDELLHTEADYIRDLKIILSVPTNSSNLLAY